jgi:MYXO-CTERM domain-containing protein
VSDYLTATLVNDSGMGRGFFLGSDEPLRQLDPVDFEWTWPEDIGEVHDEGRIIGGAFWDLRDQLRQKYGNAEGTNRTDYLWFEAIRRAVDIPSAYFETLVADDNDGNLMNGTPNVCEINEAFGSHGLFQVPGIAESIELTEADELLLVELEMSIPFAQCGTEADIELQWRDRDNPDEVGSVLVAAQEGALAIEIPKPPDGTVLQWAVEIRWNVGTTERHPSNLVDPWYEHYVGPVIPLYCTSFEDGLPEWVATDDLWELGNQGGGNASGDPQSPNQGEVFVGTNLSLEDGLYPPGANSTLFSPFIPTQGYSNVRLQYWRDLNVEDGYFDQASILANGETAWSNFASSDDFAATRHHRDARWRFHDVDLSAYLVEGGVEVGFALRSDGGLHFGGWNVDDFCVVAVDGPACGNGVVDPGEACDDGNTQDGDGCSADCELEGGDESDDDGSSADESEAGTGFGDEGPGQVAPRGCDCRSAGGSGGPAGLMLLALFGLARRRRA